MEMSIGKKTAIVAGVSVVAASLAVAAFLPYGQQTRYDAVASAATSDFVPTQTATPVSQGVENTSLSETITPISEQTSETVEAPLPAVDEEIIPEDVVIAPVPEIEGVVVDTEDEGLGGDEMIIVDPAIDISAAAEVVSEPVYDEFIAPEPIAPAIVAEVSEPVPEVEFINGVPTVDYDAAVAATPEGMILRNISYNPETKTVVRTYEDAKETSGYDPQHGYWSIGTAEFINTVPSLLA